MPLGGSTEILNEKLPDNSRGAPKLALGLLKSGSQERKARNPGLSPSLGYATWGKFPDVSGSVK